MGRPTKTKIESTCLNCNETFTVGKNSTGKYCSVICSTLYRSELKYKAFFAGKHKPLREVVRKYLAKKYGYKCTVCGLSEWQNKKITLQVDHINGDPSNDHHTNLRLICPNCHSQTPYLGNGNRGRGRGSLGISLR